MKTEEKWAAHVSAWRSSGKTAKTFSAEQKLSAASLYAWASRLSRSSRKVPMARVVTRATPVVVHDASITIEVRGARVSVRRGVDTVLLREVLTVLGVLS